jgi:hypothetical protein
MRPTSESRHCLAQYRDISTQNLEICMDWLMRRTLIKAYRCIFPSFDWNGLVLDQDRKRRTSLQNLPQQTSARCLELSRNTWGFSSPEASSWCDGKYCGTEPRIKNCEAGVLENTFVQKLRDGGNRRIPSKKGFERIKGLHSEIGRSQPQCFDAPALSVRINT